MTMAIDSRQQHHLGALGAGGGGYDPLRYTTPFQHSWAPPPQQLYHTSNPAVDHTQTSRAPSVMSMGYVANPAASSLGPELVPTRPYNAAAFATSAPTSQPTYAHSSMPRYSPEQAPAVSPYGYDADMSRRSSYGASTHGAPAVTRGATFDEMAGARGILAMSHDITPRPIYNTSGRDPADSYGFPPTHSPHGSVSSASTYPYYSGGSSYGSYAGSVDGSSVTDYSSASEDQMVPRTTLPGTNQLVSGFPPEPASMMTQFNSKMSPSAQKKHKCRICDKRFTRPSSLQTHMYSHTGEKPFACDHEGCGRHFSVVSNLRRHKKVHKEERKDDIDEE